MHFELSEDTDHHGHSTGDSMQNYQRIWFLGSNFWESCGVAHTGSVFCHIRRLRSDCLFVVPNMLVGTDASYIKAFIKSKWGNARGFAHNLYYFRNITPYSG